MFLFLFFSFLSLFFMVAVEPTMSYLDKYLRFTPKILSYPTYCPRKVHSTTVIEHVFMAGSVQDNRKLREEQDTKEPALLQLQSSAVLSNRNIMQAIGCNF